MYKSRTELWEKSVRSHEGYTQSPILVGLMRKYFRGSDTRSCGGFQAGVMAGAKALRQKQASWLYKGFFQYFQSTVFVAGQNWVQNLVLQITDWIILDS